MDRANAIKTSLRAFVCGLVGFLPVIGLICAIYTLLCWVRVCNHYGDDWNPAAGYLKAGVVLASLGLLGSLIIVLVIAGTYLN